MTDYESITAGLSEEASPDSELVRYEELLRRELSSRVRQELEVRIEEAIAPVEETLRSQLVDIVHDMQLQLVDLYKCSRSNVSGSTASHEVLALTAGDIEQLPQTGPQGSNLEDALEPYQPPPPYLGDFGNLPDLNDWMWEFARIPSDSAGDSGYGTWLGPLEERPIAQSKGKDTA